MPVEIETINREGPVKILLDHVHPTVSLTIEVAVTTRIEATTIIREENISRAAKRGEPMAMKGESSLLATLVTVRKEVILGLHIKASLGMKTLIEAQAMIEREALITISKAHISPGP